MIFTEQQLQVKKLVDVQQDIEIDALNDGINAVNNIAVENAQDISDQSDRIDSIEDKVSSLEAEDTQIYNTISNISNGVGQAITDAVTGVMTSIETQTTTAKVVATEGTIGSLEAGSVKIPLIDSVSPVESNKVLGYDSQGNIIPIEATYDLGVPSNAVFLKTDSNGEVEAGTIDTTVTEDSENPVTSGAVYTAISNATDTLDSKIDFTASGLSTRIDAVEQGQSLVISNNPADNKIINVANQKVLMYDPITNKVWWTDVNIVPPMDSNTSGKVLSNASDNPEWVEITDADGVNVTKSNGVITIGIDSSKILAPAPTVSDSNKVLMVNSEGDAASWELLPVSETFLRAGNSNSTTNDNTTNGNTYLQVVENDAVSSQLNIKGTKGVTVSSSSQGVITIEGQERSPTLLTSNNTSNYSANESYLVRGPGEDNANTNYYLAGNGYWVNGILVPIPTEEGKTLKSHSNGTVYWG